MDLKAVHLGGQALQLEMGHETEIQFRRSKEASMGSKGIHCPSPARVDSGTVQL
jgi:hypothetical protein